MIPGLPLDLPAKAPTWNLRGLLKKSGLNVYNNNFMPYLNFSWTELGLFYKMCVSTHPF